MTEQPKRKLMARLRALRQSDGWVRVEVWLPARLVPKLRAYVKRITADSANEVKR